MKRIHEDEVRAVLKEQGWTLLESVAIAIKTYQTAVGPKDAHAYITRSAEDDPNVTLAGDYRSEGRNILEPHGVLLPKDATPDVVRVLATRFSIGVDAAVGLSYAARLLSSPD